MFYLIIICKDIFKEEESAEEEEEFVFKYLKTNVSILTNCSIPSKNVYTIKLYIGGGKGTSMETLFKGAHLQLVRRTGVDVKLITLDHAMIKNAWEREGSATTTEHDVARWLQDSHAHYIICHPHQQTKLNWEARTVYRVFKSVLTAHPGFPYDREFDCAIYSQDKYVYIEPMVGFCNPTLKIECIAWLRLNHNEQIDMLSR